MFNNYSLVFISPVAAQQVIVYFLGFGDSTLLSWREMLQSQWTLLYRVVHSGGTSLK